MKARKVLSIILVIMLMFAMGFDTILMPKVSAAKASTYVKNATIQARLDAFFDAYEPGVDFFTKNGRACSCHASSVDCIAATSTSCNCLRRPKINGKTVNLEGSQCIAYVRYCQELLFGCNDGMDTSEFTKLSGKSSLDATKTKAWFTTNKDKLHPGTHIRVYSSRHSVCLLKVDYENGKVYLAECNWTDQDVNNGVWCKVNSIREYTWSKFAKTYGSIAYAYVYPDYYSKYPETNTLTMQFNANGATIPVTYEYKVTTGNSTLTLRKTASLTGEVLASIPNGTTITATQTTTADNYTWAKVTYGGKTGWCAVSGGLAARQGYYLKSNLVYQYSNSKLYTLKWAYGTGGKNGLPNCASLKMEREGYRFVGWSLTPDGSTTIFDQNDLTLKAEGIYPGVKTESKTVTLYAIWEADTPATLTFAYDANGGDGSMSTVTALAGDTVTLADNQFDRPGHSFCGWQLQRQDGQWYTELSNWATEDTMAAQGYNKKLFAPGDTLALDTTLVKLSGDHSYTLHAVWRDDSVQNIYVSKIGNDDLYYVGDTLNTTDIRLMVQYTDGSCETVTEDVTCTPMVLSKEGTQKIQVRYGDLSTSYEVTVTAVKAWKQNATAKAKTTAYLLPSTSAKTFYYAAKGDELTILCKDGSFYLGFYPWLASDITQANGMLVYIPTSGVTLNSGVTVPNAADFYTINRNGTMKNDAAVYHRTNTTAANTNGTDVTKLGTLKKGTSVKVLFEMNNYYCVQTATYTGFVAKSSILLDPVVCGVYVDGTSGADRLEIAPGAEIDTSNLYIAAVRSDGTVYQADANFQLPNTETAGRKYMIVTYEGYTTFVPVDVVEKVISRIYVYTPPIQQNYNKYETLDPAGMSIAVVYEDGTEEILTEGFLIGEHDFTEPGYVMIDLEYKGFITQYAALAYSLVTLDLNGAVGYRGETVSVPMGISCETEELHIYSYETELHYNPQQLAYQGFKEQGVANQETIEEKVLTATPMEGGILKVVYTSETPIPLNEILVTFDFQVIGEICEEPEDNVYVIMPETFAPYDYSQMPLFSTCSYSTVINLGNVTISYECGEDTTNIPETLEVVYGQQAQITAQVPVRPGYKFEGWSLSDLADTLDFLGGETVTCDWDMVLYPVWTRDCSAGHDMAVTENIGATCTQDGKIGYTCTRCGEYEEEVRPATGHSYDSGVMTAAPSCTQNGTETYTCGNCGDTYTKSIPAAGHNYVSGICTECGTSNPEYAVLSGTIISYGAISPVTFSIYSGDSGEAIYTASITDDSFSVTGLEVGVYTVAFSKSNHVTRTYSITVSGGNVQLDAKILLVGDVTGDGRINVGDVSKLYAHIRSTAPITDEYQLQCGNVNGGSVNVGDVSAIYAHIKGTKKLY